MEYKGLCIFIEKAMHKLIYLLIVISLLNCETRKRAPNAYIISREEAKLVARNSFPMFYSSCNIILDNHKAYIHRLFVIRLASLDVKRYKPDFLGLMPNDFIILNENELTAYLENNVFESTCTKGKVVAIASQKDTITSSSFFILSKYLKNKGPFIVRRTTEEEDYVLRVRKEHINYNPEKVEWIKGFKYMEEIKPIWRLRKSSQNTNYRP